MFLTYTIMYPYFSQSFPGSALDPDYRRMLALRELLAYHADVLCLQEVDERAFRECFAPGLAAHGEG